MTVSLSPAHGEDPCAAVESDMRSAAVAWLSGPAPPWLPNRIPIPPSIMSDGFRPPLWVSWTSSQPPRISPRGQLVGVCPEEGLSRSVPSNLSSCLYLPTATTALSPTTLSSGALLGVLTMGHLSHSLSGSWAGC